VEYRTREAKSGARCGVRFGTDRKTQHYQHHCGQGSDSHPSAGRRPSAIDRTAEGRSRIPDSARPGGKFEVARAGWYPAHTIDHQNTLTRFFWRAENLRPSFSSGESSPPQAGGDRPGGMGDKNTPPIAPYFWARRSIRRVSLDGLPNGTLAILPVAKSRSWAFARPCAVGPWLPAFRQTPWAHSRGRCGGTRCGPAL
jgi:hypothetical protein